MNMAIQAALVLLCPIALGVLLGVLLRRPGRGRFAGAVGALALLLLPALVATLVTVFFPVVGLWDAVTEGLLAGTGLLWAAHRWFADRRNILLTAGSVVVSLLFVEAAARLFLGTPPAYPIGDGPHFLLSSVLRTTGPDSPTFHHGAVPGFLERIAMRGDPDARAIADRPPSVMVTREIVCSIAYGGKYSGVIDVSRELAQVFPEHVAPRPGASRRVLHVGDSMVFGANVARDRTFTVNLEKLEADVQHLNGGISGMAPDDYLVVLRKWVARIRLDLAVMYLFAGNDMNGLDAPHPCSRWESILVYEGGRAALRFPDAPESDRGIGLTWLLINSPLPYLARVMIVWNSAAAAFCGAALDAWASKVDAPNARLEFEHLEAILRSARDELGAQNVAFAVVVLPHAGAIGLPEGPSDSLSREARAITQRLGIPTLDATQPIREALARGEHPIQPDGSHFTDEGHWLMARWLHAHLNRAASRSAE
jgi:hypothetical protein